MNFKLLSLSFAFFGAAGSSFAQTWDGGAGTGLWGTATNWSGNTLPISTSTVTFDAANANSQYAINLGANRTVAGVVFISAAGTNAFTFSNNTLTVGSSGIVNNDADTQTFNSGVTLNASQTWNAAAGGLNLGGAVNVGAYTLTVGGSFDTTFANTVAGNGVINKQGSGNLIWYGGGAFNGTFNNQAGTSYYYKSGNVTLSFDLNLTAGSFYLLSGGSFSGFGANAQIDGGALLTINPGTSISGVSGTVTLGGTGGTIDLVDAFTSGAKIGTLAVNTTNGFSVIKYGIMANTTSGALGWDTSGTDLTLAAGDLSGSGNLSFQLNGGALLTYGQGAFNGALNFTGVSGGDAFGGSGSTNVGRLLLNVATATFARGLTFDNAMQVSAFNGARIIDSDITINSGTTAFQGESRNGAAHSLSLGNTVGGYTLTVKDGATADLDVRFRDDSGMNQVGNLILNNNTVLEAGATMTLRKSATVAGETVGSINVFGNVTGQGTSAKESTLSLNTSLFNFDAASRLIVNGSGTGGLRIQGAQSNVTSLLTPARLQGLTGTGGTFTIAYSDSVTNTISAAPTTGSKVTLGFDAQGGSSPTYRLGGTNNDLGNWGGLLVRGGTVQAMKDQSFIGSTNITTLSLQGGTLNLNDGSSAHSFSFEGGANLNAGTLNSGTLLIGGDLTYGTTTLANNPNITMTNTGANVISGNSITGLGTFTKTGAGTVTENTPISGNTLNLLNGTLTLTDGVTSYTNTFQTAVNLTAGTLNSGTLVVGGDLTHGTATLLNNPNFTLNNSGSNTITGSAITGIGTLTKTGAGTVTVGTSVSGTTLNLLNGTLSLNNGSAQTGTFQSVNLTAGTLNSGTLVVGGDLTHGTATLANNPNITMTNTGANVISGSSITGLGTFTKTGAGTVTENTPISGNTLNLLNGTLNLTDGVTSYTNTFQTAVNLTAGTLNSGTLVVGGDLTHGTATLLNSPNFTLNNSGSNTITGSAITGIGTLTKTGAGTVTVGTSVSGTTLNLLNGTLNLNNGSAQTATFQSVNLTGGTLNSGTLVVGGDLTHGSATLTSNPNITMNVSGAYQISGTAITGVGTLTKTGVGTVTLNTSVTANTIDIQNGTLLLGGANRIGDTTAINLSGGTLGTAGYSETVGTLTLAANSTIDFGSGASILNFADSHNLAWTGTTLWIVNWSGSWTGGGTDQLIFGSSVGGLTSGQMADIVFVNPNGFFGTFAGKILSSGEIVPIPEPATIGFGALLLGSLGFRERNRLSRWLQALLQKFATA